MATNPTPRTDFSASARDIFGKPGTSWPTPVTDDFVVVRSGAASAAQYRKLKWGTPDDQFNGQGNNLLALLVDEKATPGNDNTLTWTRVYASNRQNQQLWSYSLSWALNSGAHVVTSRSFLVLRSDYVATNGQTGVSTVNRTPLFTPDPLYPGALLVSETAAPAEDPYGKIYWRITQTFETLPGPVLTGEERTKIGRTVTLIPPEFLGAEDITITTQIVLPGTRADAVNSTDASGGIVLSSIVTALDAAHSQKVNITRANNPYPTLLNRGLDQSFGSVMTTTARNIVAPGSGVPSSFFIIDASLRAISADNALLEVTTASSFPVLEGASADSNVPAKFLAAFTLDDQIDWVDTTSATADSYVVSGAGVLSCKVVAESIYRAKRTTTRLPAGATLPTLYGAEMSNIAGGVSVPLVEQIVAAGTPAHTGHGVIASNVESLNSTQSLLTYSQVTGFPALAFYDVGRATEAFPGKYGNGGGGGRAGVRQKVPTGTTPAGAGAVLSRTPINEFTDEVEVGTLTSGTGVDEVNGMTFLPSGDQATVTFTLGGSPITPDFYTIISTSDPAGGGQIESHDVRAVSFHDAHGKRVQGAAIPERLLAGLQVFEDVTYRMADPSQTPDVPTGPVSGRVVLSSEIQPHEGYVFRGKQVTRSVDLTLAQPLTNKEAGRDAGGGNVATTEKAVLTTDAAPTMDFRTLEYTRTDAGNGASVDKVRTLTDTAFPVLLDLVLHEGNKYGIFLKEEHQVVDATTVPINPLRPTGGVSIVYEADPRDHRRATKITRTLILPSVAIPDKLGERVMHRPFLIKSIVGFGANNGSASSLASLRFYIDGERTRDYIAQTRIVTTIQAHPLLRDDIAGEPRGIDYIFNGDSQQINERNACYDGGFWIKDSSGEIFEFRASDLTYTDYLALIGTEVIVSSVVSPYEWGLDIRETVYATVQ